MKALKFLGPWMFAIVILPYGLPEASSNCVPEREGVVQVSSCELDGTNYRLIKGETTLKGRVSTVYKVLASPALCPTWRDRCKRETVVKRLSDHEWLVETVTDVPWPLDDRISLVRLTWGNAATPLGGVVAMIASEDALPVTADGVRVTCIRGIWHLRQEGTDHVSVRHEVVSNPGVPAFLANTGTIDNVKETLSSLQKAVADMQNVEEWVRFQDAPSIDLPDVGARFSECVNASN